MSNLSFKRGIFKEELKNRFLCLVEVDGEDTLCYIPSSCRLSNFVSMAGKTVLLSPVAATDARTKYSVEALAVGHEFVLLNMSKANKVVIDNIHSRRFAILGKRSSIKKECTIAGYKSDLYMKNKDIDLLIVVNMFLTGFDATTLNTLWVDKNLKMHGLIQAYSRTNRILNSIKTFGNIVCFRNLQKRTDEAIALFGDRNAGGIVLMRGFKDYYYGYKDEKGLYHPGYADMIGELTQKFPVEETRIEGEALQKEFIVLFGAILRMRNLLTSFDDFAEKELLSERDLQDYLGKYQDLRDEWKARRREGDKEDITDDVVFEVELIKQIEINIDYILLLVKKYHDSHGDDKEVLITIHKAIDASPELRSKKALIDNFIDGINEVSDVLGEWHEYVAQEREKQLCEIIKEENLHPEETHKFIENSFRDGGIKTTGTEIDKIMPSVSRFGGGREKKKRTIIEKLKVFFERFFGIG